MKMDYEQFTESAVDKAVAILTTANLNVDVIYIGTCILVGALVIAGAIKKAA